MISNSPAVMTRLRAVGAKLQERVGAEQLLLIFLLSTSSYMFIEAFNFPHTAARFPQFTSAGVIVGSLLLLFRNYLPGTLEQFVAKPVRLLEGDAKPDNTDVSPTADSLVSGSETEPKRPVSGATFTTISSLLYVTCSYLFGMLWMTPLFIAVYGRWFRLRWYKIVAMIALTFATAVAFMRLLYLPLDEGILLITL